MRLLHTADLHLGMMRGRVSRWEDQQRVLTDIADIIRTEGVDALLIAGDVFNDRTHQPVEEIANQFLERFLVPLLRDGTSVVLMSGNHDNQQLFRLMDTMLRQIAGEERLPLLVCHRPGVYTVPGFVHQVIAVPYLTSSQLRTSEFFEGDVAIEGAERNQALGAIMEQGIQYLGTKVDPERPAVFVGHTVVAGHTTAANIELDYAHDIKISAQSLPHYTQYNALGHIHLCQPIDGASKPTWYSGAPDRQDLGERAYIPRVLLVDLPNSPGVACHPVEVEIRNATPFTDQRLEGQEGVNEFLSTEPSPNLLGRVQLGCGPAVFSSLRSRILDACSRLDVIMIPVDSEESDPAQMLADPYDVRKNVTNYLKENYSGHQRELLVNAFDALSGELDHED